MSDQTVYMMFAKLERLSHWDKEPHAMLVQLTDEEVQAKQVTRDVQRKDLLPYPAKLVKGLSLCWPGAVFPITKTEDGIQYQKHVRPEFSISNDQVSRWHAEHRATQRSWEAAKRLEKGIKSGPDRKWLIPYRDAYRRLPGPAKVQLIADMVAFVTYKG